jgi:hypothetical protein
VVHLVAVDDQVSNRSLGVRTVYGNAKSVPTSSGGIAAVKSLFNVMDVVLQKFYMGSDNIYAQWRQPVFGRAIVPNFKSPRFSHSSGCE